MPKTAETPRSARVDHDPIYRILASAEYLGVSRATAYRLVADKKLPPPIKVSPGASGWRKSTLDAFLDEREAESRGDNQAA